jgi:hypothetical protein
MGSIVVFSYTAPHFLQTGLLRSTLLPQVQTKESSLRGKMAPHEHMLPLMNFPQTRHVALAGSLAAMLSYALPQYGQEPVGRAQASWKILPQAHTATMLSSILP